jgi:hypothetical protein
LFIFACKVPVTPEPQDLWHEAGSTPLVGLVTLVKQSVPWARILMFDGMGSLVSPLLLASWVFVFASSLRDACPFLIWDPLKPYPGTQRMVSRYAVTSDFAATNYPELDLCLNTPT